MTTNLPFVNQSDNSEYQTKVLLTSTGQSALEFATTDYDMTLSFFIGQGFSDDAASVVANAILTQAKKGYVYTISDTGAILITKGKAGPTPVFKILDTLKPVTGTLFMSTLVGSILNGDRGPTSILGYKQQNDNTKVSRNVAA
jgi:hypothetical protein